MRSKRYFFVFLAILGFLVATLGFDGVRTWRAAHESAAGPVAQTAR